MSYDALAFGALNSRSGASVDRHCPRCKMSTRVEEGKCSQCGFGFPVSSSAAAEERKRRRQDNDDDNTNIATMPTGAMNMDLLRFLLPAALGGQRFMGMGDGGGGAPPFAAPFAAGDLERALNLSMETRRKTPTAKNFIDNLTEQQLTQGHFVPVVLRCGTPGASLHLRCCRARFGSLKPADSDTKVRDSKEQQQQQQQQHDEKRSSPEKQQPAESKVVICDSAIVASDPIHGEKDEFANASEVKGSICIMKRGKVSFIEKARRAERAGCLAVVVIQSETGAWPYEMTDSTNSKPEVKIPAAMISHADGCKLLSVLESHQNKNGSDNSNKNNAKSHQGCLFSVGMHLSCSICRDDFALNDPMNDKAISLPCGHYFHASCIKPWLKEQSMCPMCRYALPKEKPKTQDLEAFRRHYEQRRAEMFS